MEQWAEEAPVASCWQLVTRCRTTPRMRWTAIAALGFEGVDDDGGEDLEIGKRRWRAASGSRSTVESARRAGRGALLQRLKTYAPGSHWAARSAASRGDDACKALRRRHRRNGHGFSVARGPKSDAGVALSTYTTSSPASRIACSAPQVTAITDQVPFATARGGVRDRARGARAIRRASRNGLCSLCNRRQLDRRCGGLLRCRPRARREPPSIRCPPEIQWAVEGAMAVS